MSKKQAEWYQSPDRKFLVRRHGGGNHNKRAFASRCEKAIETKFRQTKRKDIEEELKNE